MNGEYAGFTVSQGASCAQDIPLAVVFEDEHLLVVNKAAGMVAHPSPGHASGTLVNALLHRFQLPALRLNADGLAVSSGQNVPSSLLAGCCYQPTSALPQAHHVSVGSTVTRAVWAA